MSSTYLIIEREICGNCKHFRRHYIKRDGCYFGLDYGHCVYPRVKKRPDGATCPHWEACPPPKPAGEWVYIPQQER